MSNLINCPIAKIDSKYTFGGVVDEFWDTLSTYHWSETTKIAYAKDYNDRLIPRLCDRPLDEYAIEDFDAVIADIQKCRPEGKPYLDSTLDHFRYLIRIVISKAAKENIIPFDILWGTRYAIPINTTKERHLENERVVLQKSLSIEEDILVFKYLMSDPYQPGPDMGLALMYAFSARNGEAAGATFGDILAMKSHPGRYVLRIFQTISANGAKKRRGKTRNAPRKLAFYGCILDFLFARKAWLEEKIVSGEIILADGQSSVDDLPIACKANDFTSHCTPNDLTIAGRKMFKAIQLKEETLAYIDAALQNKESQLEMMGIYEKDPTSYLLRRHMGMLLSLLQLTESEIEAWMAHKILDTSEQRNDYENEDLLLAIAERLENRPLFSKNKYPYSRVHKLSADSPQARISNTPEIHLHGLLKKGQTAFIHIDGTDLNQELHMSISSETGTDNLQITRTTHATPPTRNGLPNIIAIMHKQYQETEERLNRKRRSAESPPPKED